MLAEIVQLADNLWVILEDLCADIPNSIIYLKSDRLYIIDTGAGQIMRSSILKVLKKIGPVQSFTLLNSHGHADHIGNNDVINVVQAKEKHHYLSQKGLTMLEPAAYFADQFYILSEINDPVRGFQTNRLRWRLFGFLRDLMALFLGERRALEIIFFIYLRKFHALHPSRETITSYESLQDLPITVGGTNWEGWILGENDVYVLEARGHTPDVMLFYIPEHRLLYCGDLTLPLFPTFPASNGAVTREMVRKCKDIVASGVVSFLIDGHHNEVYDDREVMLQFLETLLDEHEHFQMVLKKIIRDHQGLTVAEVYSYVYQLKEHDSIIKHYLRLEYPRLPMALQQIIAVSLLQLGFEVRGPKRNKRFYEVTK